MRILAISDIHGNLACVRKLRAQEANDYDVVAVAGDIGTEGAADIFATLATFGCPVVYVKGNWDRMPDGVAFGPDIHLVHLDVAMVGGVAFAGYSYAVPLPAPPPSRAAYARQCRRILAHRLRDANVDPARCVLITHDRAAHLGTEFPGLALHLYGHVHRFEILRRGATTLVNTSALDRVLAVLSETGEERYANAGNYAVITLDRRGAAVECRLLQRNYGHRRVLGRRSGLKGPPPGRFIPEDAAVDRASDQPE